MANSHVVHVPPPPTAPAPPPPEAPPLGGVINKSLATTTNLVKLLPTATVLTFQALYPSFANRGQCYTSNKYLTISLIAFCSISCVFFSFTDSIVGRDGKFYTGMATFEGFYVFNHDMTKEEMEKVFRNLRKYRIRTLDFVHAFFSVLVFLTVTFSQSDILRCFFRDAGEDKKQLLENLPLGMGFLSALVFIVFPTTRKGIGYSEMTAHQQD